jgi:hypothetical protein
LSRCEGSIKVRGLERSLEIHFQANFSSTRRIGLQFAQSSECYSSGKTTMVDWVSRQLDISDLLGSLYFSSKVLASIAEPKSRFTAFSYLIVYRLNLIRKCYFLH